MGYEPPRGSQSIGCDNVIYPFHVIYNNDDVSLSGFPDGCDSSMKNGDWSQFYAL